MVRNMYIGSSVCSTMSSRNVARIGELLTVQIGREIYGLSLIKYQKNDCSYKRHVFDSFKYLTVLLYSKNNHPCTYFHTNDNSF